jgi:hypothetical protein
MDYSFIMLVKKKIQHFCGDVPEKNRMFKFIKSEYLEIANQMRAYCRKKSIRKITIFEKYTRNRRISS